jgi:hypothetical protein
LNSGHPKSVLCGSVRMPLSGQVETQTLPRDGVRVCALPDITKKKHFIVTTARLVGVLVRQSFVFTTFHLDDGGTCGQYHAHDSAKLVNIL